MSDSKIKKAVELLYTGRSRTAARFRYALMAFDIATVTFFVVTVPLIPTANVLAIDYAIGSVILVDFLARLWIAPSKLRMVRQIYTLADILVILSLLLAPFIAHNLAFLRVLRTLRLLHSYHVLRDLRGEASIFRKHEEVIVSTVNLFVFIFLVTALVYALQFRENPDISSFVDALYFTVATLTTTGFGDITLTGDAGRLLTVFIMIVGVALFLKLAQAIFRPQKIAYTCAECGLSRHETDAVHCKHCGESIKIETEGHN
ncbi:MAG: ion transporter [Rhodospirillales bacterium]|nr:ion transporter [Rhodospirillales bacterium]